MLDHLPVEVLDSILRQHWQSTNLCSEHQDFSMRREKELVLMKLKIRAVCTSLKNYVSHLSQNLLMLSSRGARELTPQFLSQFSGEVIIFCGHDWNLENVWIESSFAALRLGVRVKKLIASVRRHRLHSFTDRLESCLSSCTSFHLQQFCISCRSLSIDKLSSSEGNHVDSLVEEIERIIRMNDSIKIHFDGGELDWDTTGELFEDIFGGPTMNLIDISALEQNMMLGTNGAALFAKSFCRFSLLQSMDLTNNALEDAGATSLAKQFHHLINLQELLIGDNNIHEEGSTAIAQGLCHLPKLQSLIFNNGFGPPNVLAAAGATALGDSLRHVPGLQILFLDRTDLGPEGCTGLAEGFRHITNLRELSLKCNRIGARGGTSLARALGHVTGLQRLSLAGAEIGPGGGMALAAGLRHVPCMDSLVLSNNFVGGAAATSIAEALAVCGSLECLWLCHNDISHHEGEAIARRLTHLTALRNLMC